MSALRLLAGHFGRVMLVLVAGVALVACGGDDEGNNGEGPSADPQSLERAERAIAPFMEEPSPIPVTEPLERRPTGAEVIFAHCGRPECTAILDGMKPAAKLLGIELSEVAAGDTAGEIRGAFSSVVQREPDAVIIPALDPALFPQQMDALHRAGVPAIAIGLPEPLHPGIVTQVGSAEEVAKTGRLLADYVYVQEGNESDVVFFAVPEFRFGQPMSQGFTEEFEELCPSCEVDIVEIPAHTIGSTAPSRVVAYLQRNPQRNWAVFQFGSVTTGVPQALKTAGIDVKILEQAAGPQNLQDLKAGLEEATLNRDLVLQGWIIVDMAARAITGQPIPEEEDGALPPGQFLTQEDITFDLEQGWISHPDFREHFQELWGLTD